MAAAALRNKHLRKWDAIRQLIRYKEIVGRDLPISVRSIETGELFVDAPPNKS